MACPAMPTCGLAMTEAERILPTYLDAIEAAGLGDVDVVIRMTGCPNGCARPYLAEIALVGKAPGQYSLFLGGDGLGTRLNKLTHENVNEAEILNILDEHFAAFAARRKPGESFGDFVAELL